MTQIDYIIIAPIIFGVLLGLFRGFFRELASLICVFIALFATRYFGEDVAIFLSKHISIEPQISKSVSTAIVFIAVIIGVKLLASILTKLSETLMIGWLNRIFGMVLGGVKWLLIVSLFLNILSFFTDKNNNQNRRKESRLYNPTKNILLNIIPLLNFQEFIESDLEQ